MTRVQFSWVPILVAAALGGCSVSNTPGGATDARVPGTDGGTPPGTDGGAPPGTDGGTPPPMTDVPCDVRDLVVTRCHTCHGAAPSFGAPMPLVTHADFHRPAVSMPGEPVYRRVAARIHDDAAPMPQAPNPRLDATELATMDAWIAAGAPMRAAGVTCDAPPPPPPPPDELPCTPTHTFAAHAAGSTTAPYAVSPRGDNQYVCFTWRSPFATTTQATAWGPVIDDDRVVHHWILWRTTTSQADGGVGPCNMPADATFLMGWAPGGENTVMPDDIGLELAVGGTEYLILQVHYWNAAGHTDVMDRSGVQICTTPTPRTHEAGILTLGTTNIDIPARARGYSTTGTCPSFATNLLSEPLHILYSGPHMHQLGTRFRTEIIRGGRTIPLVSVDPWDFETQVSYPHDAATTMIQRGDELRTTCTYDNPGGTAVSFGERTEDEMCFNFAMVYPIGAIPDRVPRICGM